MEFGDNHDRSALEEIKAELKRFQGGKVELIKDEISGNAAIFLNRPEKRNALSGEMLVQLSESIANLEQWSTGKSLILYSSGSCFCSGLDLSMVRQLSKARGGGNLTIFLDDTVRRLQALPLVSVALIQGSVIGGGAELVTAFDFRLFTPDAEMRFVHVHRGVTTLLGGGTRLVRKLGRAEALKILLSGEAISAERALELGLADGMVEGDRGDPHLRLEAAKGWLSRYMGGDYRVTRAMKQVAAAASSKSVEESLETEREVFLSVWGGPAHLEGMQISGKPKL